MGSASQSPAQDLVLVAIAGPAERSLALKPPGPYVVGRRPQHPLALLGDDHVSRDHATLTYLPPTGGRSDQPGGQWVLRDVGSRHGTAVNGIAVAPGRDYPIQHGDLITIATWTFRLVDRAQPATDHATSIATLDDLATGNATIERVPSAVGSVIQRRLALLLDCATAINAARDESSLAEAVLDAVMAGAGYSNAAILRALGAGDKIEIISQRGDIARPGMPPRLSRSLIIEASFGEPARMVAAGDIDEAMSIAQLGIDEALCIPIMLGQTIAGYLYLDNRGGVEATMRMVDDGAEFAIGLARIAAMAWSSLKRAQLDARLARFQADLDAAAEAQRWILPRREGRFGDLSYVGESRPGQHVGGDFFDLIPLPDGRLAVALGDVSGKGVAASVLVTATQGFLHAALRESGDPARAVSELNAYVNPRRPENKFVTLWVGVIDPVNGTLRYVNAGHSYAMLLRADGSTRLLRGEAGVPIGVIEDFHYEDSTEPFGPGDRLLVYSDGLVEQPEGQKDDPGDAGDSGGLAAGVNRFGEDAIRTTILGAAAESDAVALLFDTLFRYARSTSLEDDTTIVLARW